jgi:hypothetical protein
VPPNETAVAPVKFVPVMVTLVPPAVEPLEGLTPLTVGAEARNVNLSAAPVADVPPAVLTVISTTPAAWAGAEAVIDVDETTVNELAAVPLNETLVAPIKLVPVIVMLVSPAVEPLAGETLVTVGTAAWNVKRSFALIIDDPAEVVTVTSTTPEA